MQRGLSILVLLWGISCGSGLPTDSPRDDSLQTLLDEAWEFRLREDPVFATSIGRHEYDDRLASVALSDLERRVLFWRDILLRLEDFDGDGSLSDAARLNYDLFPAPGRRIGSSRLSSKST